MIGIWKECARFQTTSQRLVDQVRMIIKKGWFSDLEISEVHQKMNRESRQQDPNTIIDTPNNNTLNEMNQSNKNRNTTHPIHTEITLTQEEINMKNLKRIISEKKTGLPSLRNQNWKIVKGGTEKVNELLIIHIHTHIYIYICKKERKTCGLNIRTTFL